MRFRRTAFVILLATAVIIIALLLIRRRTRADFGPLVALCPGPDGYGYTCTGGAGFAYIDATQDTRLYADDGVVEIELPFPFTFYGTTYTTLNASSNGNLQFGSAGAAFNNTCFTDQPLPELGDMIAPFWDDLNLLQFGFLETEVVGEEPERIFVIEWDDVPVFGDNPDDRVTFAVQLFEGSNDIVFLYEDATLFTGHQGSSATIGLQSEANGLALQFSCNQPAVADAGRIHFPFPEAPNQDVEPQELNAALTANGPVAKGITAELLEAVNQSGTEILPRLQQTWANQTTRLGSDWREADVLGNGRNQLIMLWYGRPTQPELAQLAILGMDEAGQFNLLHNEHLFTRIEKVAAMSIVAADDLTQDGVADLLLQDDNGQLSVITMATGSLARLAVPERCLGGLVVRESQIIRDGCESVGRVVVGWNGREFTRQ